MRLVWALFGVTCACLGQATAPAIVGAGYNGPFSSSIAPGQLVTLYVQGQSTGTVSAVFWNQRTTETMPVVQVSPWSSGCFPPPPNSAPPDSTCAGGLAVTVQIPFDIPDSIITAVPTAIALTVNGQQTAYIGVLGQPDRIHILNSCDTIIGGGGCAPLIYHGNGQPVSWQNPASGGEELVAYATGLGQTNPPAATGAPVAQNSPAESGFSLDFNYRANALATNPTASPVNAPLFAGSTQGFVGLYQINFAVPRPPAGLEACSSLDFIADGPVAGLTLSNLTVSVGGITSFDGAGICVAPGS